MALQVVAGSLTESGLVDGIGTEARFRRIRGMDWKPTGGDWIYLADLGNYALRRMNWRTAEVQTLHEFAYNATYNRPYAVSVCPSGNYVYVSVFREENKTSPFYRIGPNANTPLSEAGLIHGLYRWDVVGESMDFIAAFIQAHYLDAQTDGTVSGIRWASDSRAWESSSSGATLTQYDDDPGDEDDEVVWPAFDAHGLIFAPLLLPQDGGGGGYWVRDIFNATYGSRIKCWLSPVFESEDALLTNGPFGSGAPFDWQRAFDADGYHDSDGTGGYYVWVLQTERAGVPVTRWRFDTLSYTAAYVDDVDPGVSETLRTNSRLRGFAVPTDSGGNPHPFMAYSHASNDEDTYHAIVVQSAGGWKIGAV